MIKLICVAQCKSLETRIPKSREPSTVISFTLLKIIGSIDTIAPAKDTNVFTLHRLEGKLIIQSPIRNALQVILQMSNIVLEANNIITFRVVSKHRHTRKGKAIRKVVNENYKKYRSKNGSPEGPLSQGLDVPLMTTR